MDETESEPLNTRYPDKVKDLRFRLDQWLLEVKAKMPKTDPLYDPKKEHQFMEKNRTLTLQNVEKNQGDAAVQRVSTQQGLVG